MWLSIRHNDVVHHFRNFYVIGLGRKGNLLWKEMWTAIFMKFGNIKTE